MASKRNRFLSLITSVAVFLSASLTGVLHSVAVDGEYPTEEGNASHVFDGTTIHLNNANGVTPAPVVWKEHEDGTLTHAKSGAYDAIFYECADGLLENFEISGKLTIGADADPGLDKMFSIIFGSKSYDVAAEAKQAMFAPRGENKGDFDEQSWHHVNGFRSQGYAWTAATNPDPRPWSMPEAGKAVEFKLVVEGRNVSVTLGDKKYASYSIADGYEMNDLAFGFYAHNVEITLSDLYYGSIKQEAVDGEYPTEEGNASHVFDGTTIHLNNANGVTPAPVVWKEHEDGTLTHAKSGAYDAIFYECADGLLENFEISGKLTIGADADPGLDKMFSIIFGSKSYDVAAEAKQAMFAPRGENKGDFDEQSWHHVNGFRSQGYAWTAATNPDPRPWSMPEAGKAVEFKLVVEGRNVSVTLGDKKYASYSIADGYEINDLAFGFYAHNVEITLSDLYYGSIKQEAVDGEYPTEEGNASHVFDGTTIHLNNANGVTPAPVVWKEHEDGTLTHAKSGAYDAIFYECADGLLENFEISGKLTIGADADPGLDKMFSIIFGSKSYDVAAEAKQAMFAPRGENKGDFDEQSWHHVNGFRSQGYAWTAATNPDPRPWSMPEAGKAVEFKLVVEGRNVSVTLGDKKYASYSIADGYEINDLAFGFYAHNVEITLSDLYYGSIKQEAVDGEYPTEEGNASHVFDGTTIHLNNANGVTPAPVVWKEHEDGTLTHAKSGAYDAIFYECADGLLENFEISGKLTIGADADPGLDKMFSIIFGSKSYDVAAEAKQAMFAPRGENKGDFDEQSWHHVNGFRSQGYAWTAATNPDPRPWSMPEAGKAVEFKLVVEGRNVSVTLGDKKYASYSIADGYEINDLAFGFYAHNVEITLSDLYYGKVRGGSDAEVFDTHDGDKSSLFPEATIKLLNTNNIKPAPSVWKERSDGTLIHLGVSAYNVILYQYENGLPDKYEIAGTLTVNEVNQLASSIAFIFSTGEIDVNLLQAAFLSTKDESGNVYNLNYTNGFRGAGLAWQAQSQPSERDWQLPNAGESVDFVIRIIDKDVTILLNNVSYASYRIEDSIDFGRIAWGFYADSANVTLSNLYYGAPRGGVTPPPDQGDQDDFIDIDRRPEDDKDNTLPDGESPGTGETALFMAALTAALLAGAVVALNRRKLFDLLHKK